MRARPVAGHRAVSETRTRRATRWVSQHRDLEGALRPSDLFRTVRATTSMQKNAVEPEPGQAPIPIVIQASWRAAIRQGAVGDALRSQDAEQKLGAARRWRIDVLEGEASRDRLCALRSAFESHPGACPVLLHVRIAGESENGKDRAARRLLGEPERRPARAGERSVGRRRRGVGD